MLLVSHPGDWVASNRIVYVQQFAVCFGFFLLDYLLYAAACINSAECDTRLPLMQIHGRVVKLN